MANKVSARAGVSRNSHRPAALLHRPDIEGPSQGGRSAHGRAQSSLSLRKGKGEFLMVDAAAMRSLFIRLFFRVSTGCVNYRARGCTLSSLCSCMLLRKSRASDSHDTDENHTQIRTRVHARARLSPRNQSASCSGTFLSSLLQLRLHRQQQWHRGRRELVLRRGCLFIFLKSPLSPAAQDRGCGASLLLPDLSETFVGERSAHRGEELDPQPVCRSPEKMGDFH